MDPTPAATLPAPRNRSTSVDRQHRRVAPRRIRVGICALDKKAQSKPMQQILGRFDLRVFQIVVFGDAVILSKPIEEWPQVDCLMSWYSAGFPLVKAEAYVKLRAPFCINDLSAEHILRSRVRFYEVLKSHGIPTPVHVIVDRDGPTPPVVVETEDTIEVNGVKLSKPFVEKPFDAENHDIFIYYPRRLGGGSKRLFRKVGNTSSKFYADVSSIRREGSYIYEAFLMTQGTDIKVYAVGPDYAHAEARKSPVVDGIVQRDKEGKEIRFPIMLTNKEKDMARRVCLAFRQNVCGFDLLRTPGRSYVCDVNGWSMVKKSRKYYEDASAMLQLLLLRALTPERLHSSILLHTSPPAGLSEGVRARARFLPRSTTSSTLPIRGTAAAEPPSAAAAATAAPSTPVLATARSGSPGSDAGDDGAGSVGGRAGGSLSGGVDAPEEELRCVVAVIRHGDRTPKQKMKMLVSHPGFLALHRLYARNPKEEAKLKSAQQLQGVLEVTRMLVAAAAAQPGGGAGEGASVVDAAASKAALPAPDAATAEGVQDDAERIAQMKAVLEKGGHFDGINRKVQLKPTRWIVTKVRRPRGTPASTVQGSSAARGSSDSANDRTANAQSLDFAPICSVSPGNASPAVDQQRLPIFDFYPPQAPPLALESGEAAAPAPATSDVDWEEVEVVCVTECLLVLKWGGVLTHAGMKQAETAGQRFRSIMYPGESVGLLRLHSTYRHDLKIYSSDEGRVQMTAASFVKGFLDLEGELTPILASLVRTVYSSSLLDDADPASDVMTRIKKRLMKALTTAIDPRKPTAASAVAAAGAHSESELGGALGPTHHKRGGARGDAALPASIFNEGGVISNHSALLEAEAPDARGLQDGAIPLLRIASAASPADEENRSVAGGESTGALGPDAIAELARLTHFPSDAELSKLEADAGAAMVDAIAPTRAAALLQALHVIGDDPRATLKRIHELMSSLIVELTSLIPQQHEDALRPWLHRQVGETAVDVASSFNPPATQLTGALLQRPQQHHRHSELDRMLRSAAESQQVVESGGLRGVIDSRHGISSPLSLETPRGTDSDEPGVFDDWCCGGESLWLMRERWSKLSRDFYNAKKDRYDLSKIPDVYDQVKYDCVHNLSLGLADLSELYRLSKSFADVVVSQEYGITLTEKKDIAARVCHHLLRKIYFDCTAVAVEDNVEEEKPPPGTPHSGPLGAAAAPTEQSLGAGAEGIPAARVPGAAESPPLAAPVCSNTSSLSPSKSRLSMPTLAQSVSDDDVRAPQAALSGCPETSHVPLVADSVTGFDTAVNSIHDGWLQLPVMQRASVVSTASPIYGLIVTRHARRLCGSPPRGRLRRKSYPPDAFAEPSQLATEQLLLESRVLHRQALLALETSQRDRRASKASNANSTQAAASHCLSDGSRQQGSSATLAALPCSADDDSSALASDSHSAVAGASGTPSCSASSGTGAAAAGATYERPPKASGTVLVPRVRRRPPRDAAAAGGGHGDASMSPIVVGSVNSPQPVGRDRGDSASESESQATPARPAKMRSESSDSTGPLASAVAAVTSAAAASSALAQSLDSGGGGIGASSSPGSPQTGSLGGGKAAIEAIVEDMNDLQETVHQLDGEALDAGYGEVKSPLRHVRTRLYFTSESHVHALVNTLKYWGYSPGGGSGNVSSGGSSCGGGGGGRHSHGSAAGSSGLLDESFGRLSSASRQPAHLQAHEQQPARLITPEGMQMLEATPELDYLTHIVLRLYENYSHPPGHPQRHRLEVLFSPGASFSPISGEPRPPRVALQSPQAAPGGAGGASPPARIEKTPPLLPLPQSSSTGSFDPDLSFDSGVPDAASAAGTASASGTAASAPRPSVRGESAGTPFVTPDVVRPTGRVAVFAGPTQALGADMASHTLPVAGVLPLNMALPLQRFEDIVSEAIYYGSQVAAAKEQHPKEEAKARAAAAAIARARGEGY